MNVELLIEGKGIRDVFGGVLFESAMSAFMTCFIKFVCVTVVGEQARYLLL